MAAGEAAAPPGWQQARVHVKRRGRPGAGSISEALDSFRSEVRFYREIAPVVGVRVPACYGTQDTDEGTMLVLEDLSGWRSGADALAAAGVLAGMHRQWAGRAFLRWPWLRPVGAAASLVEQLFASEWRKLSGRHDLTPQVRLLGERLVGKVAQSERMISGAGPLTLAHGDASSLNMRTGPDGEVALLDWEDVSAAPGVVDLAWLLVSSVEPARWDETIAAYGTGGGTDAGAARHHGPGPAKPVRLSCRIRTGIRVDGPPRRGRHPAIDLHARTRPGRAAGIPRSRNAAKPTGATAA